MYCHGPCSQPCSRPPPTHAFARDSWTSAGKSPMESLFLSPGSWCTRFYCSLQGSISQSHVSSGSSTVGLMVTFSKKTSAIPTLRAPVPAADHCQPVPPQETLKYSSVCLCGVSGSWCVQGLFEPSKRPWKEQGLILNENLPLLPSCWGFSFALGRGVPPLHQRTDRLITTITEN